MPHSLTDLAGLNVGARGFPRRRAGRGPATDLGRGPRRPDPVRQPRRDRGARLRQRRTSCSGATVTTRSTTGTRTGRPHPRRGLPDAAPPSDRRDGLERSGLVLPARRLDVSRPPTSRRRSRCRSGRGAVVAFADIEDRLRAERVRREQDAVLEAQQAALRRVAVLVAGGAASPEVFAADREGGGCRCWAWRWW